MPGATLVDHYVLAMGQPRDLFVDRSPFPFLVGTAQLVHSEASTAEFPPPLNVPDEKPKLVALAVRSGGGRNDHISVGRTVDNDIPLQHMRISRHHAHFAQVDIHWTLFDDGSRNGTWVEETRLPPKGAGHPLSLGQAVRFAELEFTFLDAGRCWELLRSLTRNR